MRWLAGAALVWLVGCASAHTTEADAGVDMTEGHCDSTMLFPSCSQQCHEAVCVVESAMCVGTDWVCDCAQVSACRDMGGAD